MWTKVPRGQIENVRFRQRLVESCAEDEGLRASVLLACREDILFFVNVFLWTYDPRAVEEGRQPANPFITWQVQDEYLLSLRKWTGIRDIVVEKSRDQGVTWLTLAFFVWSFLFQENRSFLVASWKEDLVFGYQNPNTLFWKIKYMLDNLPVWMRPEIKQLAKSLFNEERGNYINGESTTADLGRAGRQTSIFLDEFAFMPNGHEVEQSTRAVSDCRLFISTPNGNNWMKDMRDNPDVILHTIHWSSHPRHSEGLYYVDGKPRSPWYDEQCSRALTPLSIARELDISYDDSQSRMFDEALVTSLLATSVQPPLATGAVYINRLAGKIFFDSKVGGNLKIWFPESDYGGPPSGSTYCCGCDISMGKGGRTSSNSVAVFYNEQTGEKMAEYACSTVEPGKFAQIVMLMMKWFSPAHPCFLIWEDNGPGGAFGQTIIDAGWRNIYWRKNEKRIRFQRSDLPGFWQTPQTKRELLGEYSRALQDRLVVNRSHAAVVEMRDYILLANGDVVHQRSSNTADTASAGVNHGDRVIADALACFSMKRRQKLLEPRQVDWKVEDPQQGMKDYINRINELELAKQGEVW